MLLFNEDGEEIDMERALTIVDMDVLVSAQLQHFEIGTLETKTLNNFIKLIREIKPEFNCGQKAELIKILSE